MPHAPLRALVLATVLALTPLMTLAPAKAHGEHWGPHITLDTPSAWFVTGLIDGFQARATACAASGNVKELWIGMEDRPWVKVHGDAPCLNATYPFDAPGPGLYYLDILARDSEGKWAYQVPSMRLEMLPYNTSTVPGFPRFEEKPQCPLGLGTIYTLEFLLSQERAVKEYRVTLGGDICADTLGSAFPEPEDVYAVVEFTRGAGTVHVQTDAGTQYTAPMRQYDARWWHLAPLFQVWTPPEELLASLP